MAYRDGRSLMSVTATAAGSETHWNVPEGSLRGFGVLSKKVNLLPETDRVKHFPGFSGAWDRRKDARDRHLRSSTGPLFPQANWKAQPLDNGHQLVYDNLGSFKGPLQRNTLIVDSATEKIALKFIESSHGNP